MTSLVIGLSDGIFSISAPIVLGFLVRVMSVRQMCLLGSFVFVAGVVGNAVCVRIEYLIITHSFCFGLAQGLIYGPSIYLINEYFVKKRALALSIATTGASCGGVVFPLLARVLFDTYGFGGGIVMTGGIIMQVFIGSILLTPVINHIRKNKISLKDRTASGFVTSKSVGNSKFNSESSILETLKQRWRSGRSVNGSECGKDSRANDRYSSINKSSNSLFQKHQSHPHQGTQNKFLGTGIKSLQLDQFSSKLEICEEGVPLEIQSEYHTSDKLTHQEPTTKEVSNHDKKQFIGRYSNFLSDTTSLSSQNSHLDGSVCSSIHHGSSRNRLDVAYPSNNPNELDVFPNHLSSLLLMSNASTSKQTLSKSMLFQSTSTLNNTIADIISIDQDFKRLPKVTSHDNLNRDVSTFRRMLPMFCDSPLLRSASFWTLILQNFAAAIGVGLSQIFFLPLAKERGLSDEQAAFCLSLLNMLDILSHLIPGIIINFGFMKCTTVAILPMTVIGIVGNLTPFCQTYESILCMAVVYGLCMGFFYSLQSLIVIDTLGIENYSSAMGIYYLFCGMAGAISYPIAGALKDMTGTYSTTFHYLGTMQFLAAALLLVLPLAKRFDVSRGVLKP